MTNSNSADTKICELPSTPSLPQDVIALAIRIGRHLEKVSQVDRDLERLEMNFRDIYRQLVTSKSYVMPFGKYAGNDLTTIIEEWCDAQYLVWLHHNTDFELSTELLDECEGWGEQQANQRAREKKDLDEFNSYEPRWDGGSDYKG